MSEVVNSEGLEMKEGVMVAVDSAGSVVVAEVVLAEVVAVDSVEVVTEEEERGQGGVGFHQCLLEEEEAGVVK